MTKKQAEARLTELRRLMSMIKGEPCGQPADQCSNQLHNEYNKLYCEFHELNCADFTSWYVKLYRNYKHALYGALAGMLFSATVIHFRAKHTEVVSYPVNQTNFTIEIKLKPQ